MRDEEIIAGYEQEFDDGEPEARPTRRRSRWGFWMVAGTIALGCVILLVEIFANRPLVNAISRTEHDLTVAHREAQRIFSDSGSFVDAGASSLAAVDPTRTYVGADQPARQAGTISVYARASEWAAAARNATGTCFYIRQAADAGTRYLVADGDCTGREALGADQPAW